MNNFLNHFPGHPYDHPPDHPHKHHLICLAHRGASGHAPENTLAAFQKAIELGADWIELDVQAVDGELVVIHDERLERTTSGTGPVVRKRLDELKRLDAGQGEKIPFLYEVLDLADRRININIELKGENTVTPAIRLIDCYVREHGWRYDNFLLSSFNHDRIKAAKAACPPIQIAPNLSGRSRGKNDILLESINFYSIHLSAGLATDDRIRDIHRRGCRVFVFTVNRVKTIRQLRDRGVDGIFSDFPERVVQVRSQPSKPCAARPVDFFSHL